MLGELIMVRLMEFPTQLDETCGVKIYIYFNTIKAFLIDPVCITHIKC